MNELSIQRVVPHLPVALAWLLALAIGVQTALIARELIPQPESEPAPVTTAGAQPSAQAQASATQSMDLQPVLNAHLFGEVAADSGPEGDPANAPQTQLSLVLAGTIAVEDPEKGIGLIGPTASNAKVYSVGEAVDGGVKLHAVYVDRVILNRSGKLEALYLPRQLARTAPPPTARAQGQGRNTAAGVANRVRQMMNQDPGTLAEIMRPQPVFADGGQRGYRVYPGRNRAQFQRLGLTPGDLILSINGTPLNDPARGMEVFRTLGASSQVSVTIERAGQQQELVLDMTQLANQVEELNPAGGAVPMDQADQPPPNPQTE